MIHELVVEALTVTRGGRRLFERLSFNVGAGQAVALVGPNGSGKTSLLRTIAGMIRAESGTVRFLGDQDVQESPGRRLHWLGHHDGLKLGRTAGEELAFWSRWNGAPPAAIDDAIDTLDLRPLLALEVRKLSAGQRRRLALARLMSAPRPLWLLDEPLAPLDAGRRIQAGRLMSAHLARGGMILAAVHDPLPVVAREVSVGAG